MDKDELKDIVTPLVEKQKVLFTELQKSTDERFAALEKNAAVSEMQEKMARMETEMATLIDDLAKAKRSASLGTPDVKSDETAINSFYDALHFKSTHQFDEQTKEVFEKSQVFAGKSYDPSRSEGQIKAAYSGNDISGGLFVPVQEERSILRLVEAQTAMLRIAERKTTGTSSYMRPVRLTKGSAQWVGEMEDRSQTDTPTYGEVKIDVHKIMARPRLSRDTLEDAYIDMRAEISDAVTSLFTDALGEAFLHGDGKKKPQGLLTYEKVHMASTNTKVPFGRIGSVKTGKAGGFADSAPGDALIKLAHSLPSGYRSGAKWLMNSATLANIITMKDGQGNYLWQPSYQAGTPDRLLGYGIELDDNMPDVAPGAVGVAFGNFSRAYLIVSRRGMMVIRDETTIPGSILFNMDLRIGGGLQNSEAVRFLTFEA